MLAALLAAALLAAALLATAAALLGLCLDRFSDTLNLTILFSKLFTLERFMEEAPPHNRFFVFFFPLLRFRVGAIRL